MRTSSRQIAIRLPDELVNYIDELVEHGRAPSRAAVVADAVARERRRARAERDAAILAEAGEDRDHDELASYGARVPMDDLD